MKIIIETNLDLTPTGKRRAAFGTYGRNSITWYVSNIKYNELPLTNENIALTQEWLNSVSDTTVTMKQHINDIIANRVA